MNVLYLSMMMPQKSASNAGAKTLYYYISNLSKINGVKVTLIAKALDENEYKNRISGIKIFAIKNDDVKYINPFNIVKDVNSKLNPYHKLGNTLRATLYDNFFKKIQELEEIPDVIIFEFSQMLYLVDKVKKLFPSARIYASEHDVSFLWYERNMNNAKNIINKLIRKSIYNKMRKDELKQLRKCNLIMPHSEKDRKLLENSGISAKKINTIVPYYQKLEIDRKPDQQTIIFYGAMNRAENYEAAIWFIEKVMPHLSNFDIVFQVVGGKPDDKLKKYSSERVHITGYVEDITGIFSTCMCMVAPLKRGAGIKIKVLEAMYSGIPVLTNNIGIEGIPAVNSRDYYHCNLAADYIRNIIFLKNNPEELHKVEINAKKVILNHFDIDESFNRYKYHVVGSLNKINDRLSMR